MNKHAKIIIITLTVLALATAGYFIFPKSYITASIAPDGATVSIDGGKRRTVKTGSTLLVVAGKHTYVISKTDFAPQTVTLESGNNQTKELLVALVPQTDDATTQLETAASQAILQRVNGPKMDATIDTINQNYPIVKDLPIYARLYSITSCPSQKYPGDSSKIALCVDVSQDGLEPYVRKDIASRGYNPDDYEIIYSQSDENVISE